MAIICVSPPPQGGFLLASPSGITTTSMNVSFTGGEGFSTIFPQYSLDQSSWSTLASDNTTPFAYTGLTSHTLYYFRGLGEVNSAHLLNFEFGPTAATLIAIPNQITLNHEALPLGVPSGYDWYSKGRITQGTTVPTGFLAFTGWGQVFRTSASASANVPIQFRNLQTFICYGTSRTWVRIQTGNLTGAAFNPDFQGNVNVPANISVAGNVSTVTFALDTAFHFYPPNRASIPSSDVKAILVIMESKLDSVSPSDDNAYILGGGWDWWSTLTAEWMPDYSTNKDAGVGRLKYVTRDWKWFGFGVGNDADFQALYNQYSADIPLVSSNIVSATTS